MFNSKLKNEAISKLEVACKRYENRSKRVIDLAEDLHVLRINTSELILGEVENYINALANTPKEFDRTISEYRVEFESFSGVITQAKSVGPNATLATRIGLGILGVRLSGLSGLGVVGLATPVGLIIGAGALLTAGLMTNSKNKKIAQEADAQRKSVLKQDAVLKVAETELNHLLDLTIKHTSGVEELLTSLCESAPMNYQTFSEENKEELGSLINHIHSLSALLNKRID